MKIFQDNELELLRHEVASTREKIAEEEHNRVEIENGLKKAWKEIHMLKVQLLTLLWREKQF